VIPPYILPPILSGLGDIILREHCHRNAGATITRAGWIHPFWVNADLFDGAQNTYKSVLIGDCAIAHPFRVRFSACFPDL
jgi:hypothetical protein